MNNIYSWFIKIIILLSIVLLYSDYKGIIIGDKNAIFDESLVSALAFLMLILTALMQNKDLNLQRYEMIEARKVQNEQKNELKESNSQLNKNIIQTKFFELQRLKEQILNNLVSDNDILSTYTKTLLLEYLDEIINTICLLDDDDGKQRIIHLYEWGFIFGAPKQSFKELESILKTHTPGIDTREEVINFFRKNIKDNPSLYIEQFDKVKSENIIDMNEVEQSISYQFLNYENSKLTNKFIRLYKYHIQIEKLIEDEKELQSLYYSILLNEEKIIYMFIEKKVTIHSLLKYYNSQQYV
ncbi:hypothetical protein ERX37_03465 [Macrococcus hajekii]|uniref:Phage abortive infection protein n=1 Tax=Macrococcus hajekii TaxID=198482 RepID=A0A4R6BN88_9STAP|nr:hypothetical protein [Macrococcus hajekii]TDM03157.1 hypothetical protein ERX37_03465 [Macrococcus hajekii]GGA96422.1 hypothetical protein GCM10007190_00600 [Macrococcus hajekii]